MSFVSKISPNFLPPRSHLIPMILALACVAAAGTLAMLPSALAAGRTAGTERPQEPGLPVLAPAPAAAVHRMDKSARAVLATYDFEMTGGGADPQGWTEFDLTPPFLQYWRVEDFAGLPSPYAPLSGARSMWCGVRPDPADPALEGFQSLPGYGNNWLTGFATSPIVVESQLSLVFDARWSLEAGFDFFSVQYRELPAGSWNTLATYDGNGGADDLQLDLPAGLDGSQVQVRFLVQTDNVFSDEDGNFDSTGALVLDDLRIINNGVQVQFENFEGEAIGAAVTDDGFWTADPPQTPFGDFTELVGPVSVLQEDPAGDNLGHFWSFFSGSPDTYRCGQVPSQPAVPRPLDPADPQQDESFANEIRSPWIPLDLDENGEPVDLGSDVTLSLGARIYGDFPANLGVYYVPKVRFLVGGIAQDWQNPGSAFFGDDKTWAVRLHDFPLPLAATEVQVAIEVLDLAYAFTGGVVDPEACHTHGPLIDDVQVSLYSGPAAIMVTNTLGGGPGSLYEALQEAVLSPGLDNIFFNIPGPGPHEIFSVGLTIDSPVCIDGFTQPGSSPNTNPVGQPSNAVMGIVLNTSFMTNVIEATAAGSTLRGIVVQSNNDNLNGTIQNLADNVTITGCYFGTDATGLQTSGYNPRRGVVSFGNDLKVGGPDPADRCVVSGHVFDGILIAQSTAIIQGCYVGTDATGAGAMGNATDTQLLAAGISANLPFGQGTIDVLDCIVAFNQGQGLRAEGNTTVLARRTSFFGNTGLGIDSFGIGPTDDDAFAPTPVITSVDPNTGIITGEFPFFVSGLDVELDFFSNPECHPSGYGEGKDFLGSYYLESTSDNPISFTADLGPLGFVENVTATLTTDGGRTSEFSLCFDVLNTPAGQSVAVVPDDGTSGASLVFADVSVAGNTTVTELPVPPEEPTGYEVGGASFWDIQTTATFTGMVEVCFNYDEAALVGNEADVVLLHYDAAVPEWVDITTTRDAAGNQVCGMTLNLSPFVVATEGIVSGAPDVTVKRWGLRNQPNPFNPMTTVFLEIPRSGSVRVEIFDLAGRRVRTLANGFYEAGGHELVWRGRNDAGGDVSSGVYFVRLVGADIRLVHEMLLLR
jgi:hypothetical protein